MGRSVGTVSMRVMHMRRGLPLISAEQDPHLPALQFQRHARSLACVAWIWCTQSSTTMPSPISAWYSLNSPLVLSPRQIWKVAVAMKTPRVVFAGGADLATHRFSISMDSLPIRVSAFEGGIDP